MAFLLHSNLSVDCYDLYSNYEVTTLRQSGIGHYLFVCRSVSSRVRESSISSLAHSPNFRWVAFKTKRIKERIQLILNLTRGENVLRSTRGCITDVIRYSVVRAFLSALHWAFSSRRQFLGRFFSLIFQNCHEHYLRKPKARTFLFTYVNGPN